MFIKIIKHHISIYIYIYIYIFQQTTPLCTSTPRKKREPSKLCFTKIKSRRSIDGPWWTSSFSDSTCDAETQYSPPKRPLRISQYQLACDSIRSKLFAPETLYVHDFGLPKGMLRFYLYTCVTGTGIRRQRR